jgi:hypothetical protein
VEDRDGSVQVYGRVEVWAVTPEHPPVDQRLVEAYPLLMEISGLGTVTWPGSPNENPHDCEPLSEAVAATLWVLTVVSGATVAVWVDWSDPCRLTGVSARAGGLATSRAAIKLTTMSGGSTRKRLVRVCSL